MSTLAKTVHHCVLALLLGSSSLITGCSDAAIDDELGKPYDDEPAAGSPSDDDEGVQTFEVDFLPDDQEEEDDETVSLDKANYTRRSDACGQVACGSATYTFVGKRKLRNISMSIRDPYCNGSTSWIRLVVFRHDSWGTYVYTTKRYDRTNNSACDRENHVYNNLSFDASYDIAGVNIQVGDDDPDDGGRYDGNYRDNPNVY